MSPYSVSSSCTERQLLFMASDQKIGQIRLTKKSFQTQSEPKYMGKTLKKLKLHSRRNLQQLMFGEYYLPFGSEFFFLSRLLPQGAQNKIRETVNFPVVKIIPTRCNNCVYSSQMLLLYMFRVTIPPIIRSTCAVYGHR